MTVPRWPEPPGIGTQKNATGKNWRSENGWVYKGLIAGPKKMEIRSFRPFETFLEGSQATSYLHRVHVVFADRPFNLFNHENYGCEHVFAWESR